jgi:hypothetical protein
VSPNEAVGHAPEQRARAEIERRSKAVERDVFEPKQASIYAGCRVAIRDFTLADRNAIAGYPLQGAAITIGVNEAGRQRATLSDAETKSEKRSKCLPAPLPAWKRPSRSELPKTLISVKDGRADTGKTFLAESANGPELVAGRLPTHACK